MVPCANTSSPTASELTAMLGQVPGTCELGANCSETLPASEAGLGGHVTPDCVNECLICLSSPLGGVHFGQNTQWLNKHSEHLGKAAWAGGLTLILAVWRGATESQLRPLVRY